MGLKNFLTKDKIEAGCDEAGRGCLAGPVVAAAVILKRPIRELNDSKKLSLKKREELKDLILSQALAWKVTFIDARRIEEVNILNASIEAMQQSAIGLETVPELLLVDGNRFKPIKNIPHKTVIKGDGKYQCIAAASILAKTFRDTFMLKKHQEYPYYGWNTNAGYPTKKHREAIKKYGSCKLHRKTFQLLPKQIKLL